MLPVLAGLCVEKGAADCRACPYGDRPMHEKNRQRFAGTDTDAGGQASARAFIGRVCGPPLAGEIRSTGKSTAPQSIDCGAVFCGLIAIFW